MKTFTLPLAALVAISALAPSYAVIYSASNSAIGTPGGDRFQHQVGLDYALDVLEKGSSSFWYAFAQQNETDRKNVTEITVTITQSMIGISDNVNGDIRVNSKYIGNFSGDVKEEFTGIVYYELARALQWDGQGQAPAGLLTGVADFFRLKAGYAPRIRS
ncbi:uncharacterized protein A4U43_C01F34220 [Asparagus officinalis]|uniref:Uncharacterized protein n=1 Tax=Asparagus officinalis TaxID=4686 RepID=A0A5P1FV68_ASPOF|nr:uncharacterized protein LOC109841618 [Asparagus officinalis]ONK81914.1 uncharacterized protein A4U43_C01F34220 [Asparagus officinalis]